MAHSTGGGGRGVARQRRPTQPAAVGPMRQGSGPVRDNPFRAKSEANRRAAARVYIKAREKAGRPVSAEIRRMADGEA